MNKRVYYEIKKSVKNNGQEETFEKKTWITRIFFI